MNPRAQGVLARLAASLAFLLLALAPALAAEPDLPTLTGRIVDGAGILSPEAEARIEGKLKAHDDKSGDQVAVATVPSLQGLTVEDFANRLFRAWKLGQAKTNNGVLLLVAPTERKVRIEVGYGLEGALTDALTKVIITTAITPRFKQGDFPAASRPGSTRSSRSSRAMPRSGSAAHRSARTASIPSRSDSGSSSSSSSSSSWRG